MKLTTYQVAASFDVVANVENNLTPAADGLAEQLQAAFSEAVRAWQDKLRGSVMAGRVVLTVQPADEPVPTPAPTPEPTDAPL